MTKMDFMSISLSRGTYKNFVESIINLSSTRTSAYTCVANVHMIVEGYKDATFAAQVSNADIITPDGKPLSWGLRLLYGVHQERVAGMDLLPDLLQQATSKQLPVFFYGGSDNLLKRTKSFIDEQYPVLTADYYSPPYRPLSLKEEEAIIDQINQSGARLVFVVLGCPKQEKWMASMKGRINAMMIGIGGALPVMVGIQKRAPRLMQNAGLEWLFRLIREPRRLFKRYMVTNSIFLYRLLKEYLKLRPGKKTVNQNFTALSPRK